MAWKIKIRNGKFYNVTNVHVRKVEDKETYVATFTVKLSVFSKLVNPETDLIGLQSFNMFGRANTRLFYFLTESVPDYNVENDKCTVIALLEGF